MQPYNPLRRSGPGGRKSEAGSMILIATSLLLVLVTLTCIALTVSGTVGRNARTAGNRATAFAIGNSALELAFAQFYTICNTGSNRTPGASSFANLTLPTASMFPYVPNFTAETGTANGSRYTISNYKITPTNALLVPTTTATTVSAWIPSQSYVPYLATVDVNLPGMDKNVTVKLGEVFTTSFNSPWNYAIFFNNDLEINPGAAMSVNGPVHTNANLYLDAGGVSVTFLSSVDASLTINAGKSPNDPSSRNSTIAPVYPPGFPIAATPTEMPLGVSSTVLSATNPNATSYHELVEPPVNGYPDPFSPPGQQSQRYYNIADYIITLSNSTNNVKAAPIVTVAGHGNTAVSSSVYNVFAKMAGATVPNGNTNQALTAGTSSFTDDREQATMDTTNFDVGMLTSAVSAGTVPANPDSNGGLVVYIQDTRTVSTSGGTTEPAVRLTDGYTLPSQGLTVVSPNPVYVAGDYNTGGSATSQPPTDTGTPSSSTSPTVGSYWEPAAIIADAVNILSNNWRDSNSSSGLSSRTATATTVNAGILSGNVPDSTGSYSGGAENFPRFLENWSGVWFTYYGSLVNLYASKQATGLWSNASYSAPNRFWNYDTHFRTTPPPGTFAAGFPAKQQWFIRQ